MRSKDWVNVLVGAVAAMCVIVLVVVIVNRVSAAPGATRPTFVTGGVRPEGRPVEVWKGSMVVRPGEAADFAIGVYNDRQGQYALITMTSGRLVGVPLQEPRFGPQSISFAVGRETQPKDSWVRFQFAREGDGGQARGVAVQAGRRYEAMMVRVPPSQIDATAAAQR
jgi:hypothetical protein